jgi:hypothetical protein
MARVVCFDVPGIEMWIPSGDHEPPHFHARRPGHWRVRVFFLEPAGRMIRDIRPARAQIRASVRKALLAGAEQNRQALIEQWQACQG